MVGTMVFCVSCKAVVWAHDSDHGDLRATCNIFQLLCPECGDVANFDGFRIIDSHLQGLDPWGKMHEVAETNNLTWKNGPNLAWRKEPL